jgi:hypothetical protein
MIPQQRANHGKLYVHQPERHIPAEAEPVGAERVQRPQDGPLADGAADQRAVWVLRRYLYCRAVESRRPAPPICSIKI